MAISAVLGTGLIVAALGSVAALTASLRQDVEDAQEKARTAVEVNMRSYAEHLPAAVQSASWEQAAQRLAH